MAGATLKTFDEIFQDEKDFFLANTSLANDFNKGSVVRTTLEAVATVIEDFFFRNFRIFRGELATQIFDSFDFAKQGALPAVGNVEFSTPAPATANIDIPQGTLLASAQGIQYATTTAGIITIGNTTSGNVPVQAVLEGIVGNAAIGEVNGLVQNVPGISSVTNNAAISGGQDEESDQDVKARFILFIQGLARTTPSGIKSGAKEIEGVVSASVEETGDCEVTVFIDDGSGTPPQSLVDEVQLHLDENNKAAGVTIFVFASTLLTIVIDVTMTFEGFITGQDLIDEQIIVRNSMINYINGLDAGENVIFFDLIVNMKASTQNFITATFAAPAEFITCQDIAVSSGQIARTSSGDITIS